MEFLEVPNRVVNFRFCKKLVAYEWRARLLRLRTRLFPPGQQCTCACPPSTLSLLLTLWNGCHGNGERVTSDATRSRPPAKSGIAAARMRWIRIGAERSQLRCGIRRTNHREGARFVFAVERSELGRVIRGKAAVSSVMGIVEPEPHVRIEAEDLVEQDRLDANMAVVSLLADLDIRLVPSETEAALEDLLEVWIGRFI